MQKGCIGIDIDKESIEFIKAGIRIYECLPWGHFN